LRNILSLNRKKTERIHKYGMSKKKSNKGNRALVKGVILGVRV